MHYSLFWLLVVSFEEGFSMLLRLFSYLEILASASSRPRIRDSIVLSFWEHSEHPLYFRFRRGLMC